MREFAIISSISQLILMLIVSGYTVYFVKEVTFRIRTQVEYELEFLDHNEVAINRLQHVPPETNEHLPLTFQNQLAEHLLSLCLQYTSKWSAQHYANRWGLRFYEPRIEVHHLRLRRLTVAGKLFKVEMVRCSDRYALIDAGDRSSAYILEKDELNEDRAITVFAMHGKFKYRHR